MQKSNETQLKKLAQDLKEWRAAQVGRRRIPEPVWAEATELAAELGVSKVATALQLSFRGLKSRMATLSYNSGNRAPTFVEWLVAPQVASCVIKVEAAGGERMQIEANLSPAGLVEIIRGVCH